MHITSSLHFFLSHILVGTKHVHHIVNMLHHHVAQHPPHHLNASFIQHVTSTTSCLNCIPRHLVEIVLSPHHPHPCQLLALTSKLPIKQLHLSSCHIQHYVLPINSHIYVLPRYITAHASSLLPAYYMQYMEYFTIYL